MILAIDIGNTNIVVGCIDEQKTYFIERVSTDRSKTELEYAIVIKNVLDIFKNLRVVSCVLLYHRLHRS